MSDSLQPHGLYPARLLCPWEFSRQEYWNQLSCPPPGDLPKPGIKPRSPALQEDSLPSEPSGKPHFIIQAKDKNKGLHHTHKSTREGMLYHMGDGI